MSYFLLFVIEYEITFARCSNIDILIAKLIMLENTTYEICRLAYLLRFWTMK